MLLAGVVTPSMVGALFVLLEDVIDNRTASGGPTGFGASPLAPFAQGGSSDGLPIAVTAVLLTSNASNSSSFEDNKKMIRDQLEREYRSQLAEKEAQIQQLKALALTSSSAGETKASSVRIDCFFLS